MDEPLLSTEPIEAWRAWQLATRRGGLSLVPIGRGDAWPRQRAAAARCWKHRLHRAPVIACTCGLYAAREPEQLRRARSPAVVGTVALWGRVVEHALGWRARFAYPQRLALVCHVCLPQQGVTAAAIEVAAYRDGSLVPMCEPHLDLALGRGVRPRDVVPASTVLARLADAYAVEPLLPVPAWAATEVS